MNDCKYLPLVESSQMEMSSLLDEMNLMINETGKKSEERGTVLVLLGKTGHGKSSLGNTLLRRYAFEEADSVTSVTKILTHHTDRDEKLTVFDTLGPFNEDEDNDNKYDFRVTVEQITTVINCCKRGIDAFILVYNFSTKFTKEEVHTITMYKDILGEDFVAKYAIIVVTHGINFRSRSTFDKWCNDQKGLFKTLYNECNKRVVLIENKDRDDKKLAAREQILKFSKTIAEPYTEIQFIQNDARRNISFFRCEIDDLKRKYNYKIKELEAEIRGLSRIPLKEADRLKLRVTVLIDEMKERNIESEKYNLNFELDAATKLLNSIPWSCIIQ